MKKVFVFGRLIFLNKFNLYNPFSLLFNFYDTKFELSKLLKDLKTFFSILESKPEA